MRRLLIWGQSGGVCVRYEWLSVGCDRGWSAAVIEWLVNEVGQGRYWVVTSVVVGEFECDYVNVSRAVLR